MCVTDSSHSFRSSHREETVKPWASKSIGRKGVWKASDGSVIVSLGKDLLGRVNAMVIASKTFPIGTKFRYKNTMGHVMCKGEEKSGKKCILHPLDAKKFLGNISEGGYKELIQIAVEAKGRQLELPKVK